MGQNADIVRIAFQELDRLIEDAVKEKRVACEKGCYFCCLGVVLLLSKAEITLLAEFLNSLPLKERKKLGSRFRKYVKVCVDTFKEVGGYSFDKIPLVSSLYINELPCPFLEEGECKVYPVRPAMCRLTLSENKQACEKDWKDPLSMTWSREVLPFIEEVKSRVFPRWSFSQEILENTSFIGDVLTYDPFKKIFLLRV